MPSPAATPRADDGPDMTGLPRYDSLDLRGIPRDALSAVEAALNDAARREAAHLDLLREAERTLTADQTRMQDLEALVAGYRRRTTRLVELVKRRQARDPMRFTAEMDAQRRAENVQIERAHLLEPWALHVLSDGQIYPEAVPPSDWGSMQRVAEVLVQVAPHG